MVENRIRHVGRVEVRARAHAAEDGIRPGAAEADAEQVDAHNLGKLGGLAEEDRVDVSETAAANDRDRGGGRLALDLV